jgi:hypothetical protein
MYNPNFSPVLRLLLLSQAGLFCFLAWPPGLFAAVGRGPH